jgi:hypothetical protein
MLLIRGLAYKAIQKEDKEGGEDEAVVAMGQLCILKLVRFGHNLVQEYLEEFKLRHKKVILFRLQLKLGQNLFFFRFYPLE